MDFKIKDDEKEQVAIGYQPISTGSGSHQNAGGQLRVEHYPLLLQDIRQPKDQEAGRCKDQLCPLNTLEVGCVGRGPGS